MGVLLQTLAIPPPPHSGIAQERDLSRVLTSCLPLCLSPPLARALCLGGGGEGPALHNPMANQHPGATPASPAGASPSPTPCPCPCPS